MEKNISIKVEDISPNNDDNDNIEENIIINEDNGEIITINNKQDLQLEFIDVKNLDEHSVEFLRQSENLFVENENLKKELTSTQEKYSILQSLVQHQSKLIELLLRMDLIKSAEDPDKREIDDLQRKIQLCFNLIEECNIKIDELSNERRRVLIVEDAEPATPKVEKRAAIWNHFTVSADSEGEKNVECNYCKQCFPYRNMNASKCREHIKDKCEKAPDEIKSTKPRRYNPPPSGSKYTVWNYFINSMKDGKTTINCMFCGIEYSSRNATKCREHLAFKCRKIQDEVRIEMRSTFSQEYIESYNKQKRSTIWEHFNIIIDDDKKVIQCIYCCMNYANKNATKCREHLLERCDKIPLNIRNRINNSFFESPLKTWTQIKILIWKHFSIITHDDRIQYQCNYCKKIYSSKNVTKFRIHLLDKCEHIPDDVKHYITVEMTRSTQKSKYENDINDEENDDADDDVDDDDDDEYYYETQQYIKDEQYDDDGDEDVVEQNNNVNDNNNNENNYSTELYQIKCENESNESHVNHVNDDHNNHYVENDQEIIDNNVNNNNMKETRRSTRFKRKKLN